MMNREMAAPKGSLVEKVNSIEHDLLRLVSREETRSLLEDTAPEDLNNNAGEATELLETLREPVHAWPSFKKNRAILAAVLTTTAFFGTLLALTSALGFFFGIKGTLTVWLASECVFWLIQRVLYSLLNAQPKRHEPDSHDGWETYRRFLRSCIVTGDDDVPIFNPKDYVSQWFLGASIENVKRENMLELLSYGFWYKTREEMVAAGLEGVPERMLEQFESVAGLRFEDGYSSKIRFMGHLWENLHCVFRPLCFYALTEFAGVLCGNILLALGFEKRALGGVYTSYTFPGRSAIQRGGQKSSEKPIVFLHGVGLGILPYLDFLSALVCTNHPLVIIEYRHVSMRLVTHVPSCGEVAATVIAELNRLKISDACFVGHSYGTFVLTRILRSYPERVQSCCFIDPVCVGMFLPQLLSRFVYLPGRMDSFANFLRDAVRICVSRELGIAATMARRFAWTDINLWPEHLYTQRSLLVFSGRDVLVPFQEMMPILKHDAERMKRMKILFHSKLGHGEFLALPHWKLEIVNEICSLMSSDGDRSKLEERREKVERRKSLMLSLGAMQNVENAFIQRMDATFLDGVRRTLSLPWKFRTPHT